jgi:hypothetical protein
VLDIQLGLGPGLGPGLGLGLGPGLGPRPVLVLADLGVSVAVAPTFAALVKPVAVGVLTGRPIAGRIGPAVDWALQSDWPLWCGPLPAVWRRHRWSKCSGCTAPIEVPFAGLPNYW